MSYLKSAAATLAVIYLFLLSTQFDAAATFIKPPIGMPRVEKMAEVSLDDCKTILDLYCFRGHWYEKVPAYISYQTKNLYIHITRSHQVKFTITVRGKHTVIYRLKDEGFHKLNMDYFGSGRSSRVVEFKIDDDTSFWGGVGDAMTGDSAFGIIRIWECYKGVRNTSRCNSTLRLML